MEKYQYLRGSLGNLIAYKKNDDLSKALIDLAIYFAPYVLFTHQQELSLIFLSAAISVPSFYLIFIVFMRF